MIGGTGKKGIDWGYIISRLATAFKRLPSEVIDMTFADAQELFEYWGKWPPENESAAYVAMAHGWRPARRLPTEEEMAEEAARGYASGKYIRPDQMARMFGGLISIKPGDPVPGVGPLPWHEMQVPRKH
jgi:hypothetical protein